MQQIDEQSEQSGGRCKYNCDRRQLIKHTLVSLARVIFSSGADQGNLSSVLMQFCRAMVSKIYKYVQFSLIIALDPRGNR